MEDFILYENPLILNNLSTYKARRKGTINYLAVHCAEKSRKPEITNMVRLTHDIHHENIVSFVEWYETSNHLWLIVELCTTGSLEKLLKEDKNLPEECIKSFGSDLINGLQYLHSLGILFIDFSPSKIFVAGSGSLKYSHFGVSRMEDEDLDQILQNYALSNDIAEEPIEMIYQDIPPKFKNSGCPYYISPEVLQGASYSQSSDLWALGCLFYQLFTGNPPFVADSFSELCNKIINMDCPQLTFKSSQNTPVKASTLLSDVIFGLLSKKPSTRLTMQHLVDLPFWEDTSVSKHKLSVVAEETAQSVRDSIINFDSVRHSILTSDTGKTYRADQLKESEANFSLSMKSHSIPSDNIESKTASKWEKNNYNSIATDVFENISHLIVFQNNEALFSLVDNSKQKQSSFKFDSKALNFSPFSAEKLCNVAPREQTRHIQLVLDGLATVERGSLSQKTLNLLNYVGSLGGHAEVANLFLKSGLLSVLTRQIKDSQLIDTRIKVCSVLAILVSNADNYKNTENLQETILLTTNILNENLKNAKLRLVLLQVIGEILRLHFKQTEENDSLKIHDIFYSICIKCLLIKDDVNLQICTVKIISNMIGFSQTYLKKFLSNKVTDEVYHIFETSTNESLKCISIQLISFIGLKSSDHISALMQETRLAKMLKFLPAVSTKIQLAQLIILYLFIEKVDINDIAICLVKLLDSPSVLIRCKSYLLFGVLLRQTKLTLLGCETKLFQYIERDLSSQNSPSLKNSEHLIKCLDCLVSILNEAVATYIEDLKILIGAMQNKESEKNKKLNELVSRISILQHLIDYQTLGQRITDVSFMKLLKQVLQWLFKLISASHNLDKELINKLVSLTFASITSISNFAQSFNFIPQLLIEDILPLHIRFVVEATGNARGMALNSFSEICLILLKTSTPPKLLKQLHELLADSLLPHYEQLLLEPDPFPALALKLLLLLISSDGSYVRQVEERKLVPVLFQVLVDHQSTSTGGTMHLLVQLINILISTKGFNMTMLYEHGFIEHLIFLIFEIGSLALRSQNHDVTVAIDNNTVAEMLLTLLDTLHVVLRQVSDIVRKAIECQKMENQMTEDVTKNAEKLLTMNKPFKQLISILTLLLSSGDAEITDASLKCLAILIQFYSCDIEGAFSPDCIKSYCTSLKRSDPKKQKIILRLIKRLIVTESHHAETLIENGQQFIEEIKLLQRDPINQSDVLLLEVISEIMKTLKIN